MTAPPSRWNRLLWPVLMTAAIVVSIGQASPIVDSRDSAAPAGVSFEMPAGYAVFSPVSRVLDTLTLLSNPQTTALFLSLAAIVGACVLARQSRPGRRLWVRLLRSIGMTLGVIVMMEAAVIFAPRPMAFIKSSDPNIVRVDFHTHTRASRDANQRFTAEDRREWHRDGGFDVGYITDHVRFGGAVEARKNNPLRAGNGVSELSAVEGRYHKILSTIMLGLEEGDTIVLDSKGHLLPGIPISGRQPVTIVALPNSNIDSVTVKHADSIPDFSGMELVDAAPRGLDQLDREENKVRQIAANARLILVAASNNHGYGRAVAAWNLMSIPGWRDLSPDSVGRLIEQPFRERRLDGVTIVKRLRPRTHGISLPLTLPVAVWQNIASLSVMERFSWLVWTWTIVLIAGLHSPRLRPRDQPIAPVDD